MLSRIGKVISLGFFSQPIFIVGGSRSGTIALLKALGRHPATLSTPSENPFITDIGRMAYDLGHASDHDRHYYDRTLRVPLEHIYARLRWMAFESSLGPRYGIRYLMTEALKNRVNIVRKRHWCTKSFPGKNTAYGLQVLYPEARFIWILRNGMNVVYSRAKFPEFRDQHFVDHCRHWSDSIFRFSYLQAMDAATVLHQEDLVEDPDTVFRRLFEHIGVPYHPASTQFARHTHVHPLDDLAITPGVNVKQRLKDRRPPYESWSDEQRQTFKELCGEAMLVAGYEIPF